METIGLTVMPGVFVAYARDIEWLDSDMHFRFTESFVTLFAGLPVFLGIEAVELEKEIDRFYRRFVLALIGDPVNGDNCYRS